MKKILFLCLFLKANLVFSQNKNYLIECDKYYQMGDTTVCFLDYKKDVKAFKYYKNDKFLSGQKAIKNNDGTRTVWNMTDKDLSMDGEVKYYDEKNKLNRIVPMKKGAITGEGASFYPNGVKKATFTYDNKKLAGQQILFSPDGKKCAESVFLNDEQVGKVKYYSESGKLVAEVLSTNVKEEEETQYLYYPNGQLFLAMRFKYGRAMNVLECHLENGILISEEECGLFEPKFEGKSYQEILDKIIALDWFN
jgi:antitoxin component YwqK of YwqJK toxin-antitoxin module